MSFIPPHVCSVLEKLPDAKQAGANKWKARCPAHADNQPSLSVSIGTNKNEVLLHCHAGCTLQEIVAAMQIPMTALYPAAAAVAPTGKRPARRIVATYNYTDEAGKLLFQALRYDPKGFSQRRPAGSGEWLYNLEQTRRVLFKLPELLAAVQRGETVYIVEGEKDVENLHAQGLAATCNPQGAGKWRTEYNASLRGANVVLLPDNDTTGRKHRDTVGQALTGVAACVRVLDLQGLPEKGDVSDWLEAGNTADRLRALAANAPKWTPAPVSITSPNETPVPDELDTRCSLLETTDMGNADRLVARQGQDLRYCYEWQQWLSWDGARWEQDTGAAIMQRAKETARRIFGEAGAVPVAGNVADSHGNNHLAAELGKWAIRSQSKEKLQNMIALAQCEVPLKTEEMDTNALLLNCENGTLNLANGELLPARREDYITKQAAVSYDPASMCPAWERFLLRVLPDAEIRNFVQRAVGYALTGDISEQKLFFLYGDGSNGKSTFLNTLLALLAQYGMQATSDLLIQSNNEDHPTKLCDLQGRRFVATVEVDDGRRMAEGLVKSLTGGEHIRARRMYQDHYEFAPTHKIFLAANHKPVIRGTDNGIWRRIILIPFTERITDAEKDARLSDKLRAELPGILAWAVRGCLDWKTNGLRVPASVMAATEDYRQEQNTFAPFIEECCFLGRNFRATTSALYTSYVAWCKENGEYPRTQKAFGVELQKAPYDCVNAKERGKRVWRGIGLKDDAQDTQSSTENEAGEDTPEVVSAEHSEFSETPEEEEDRPVYAVVSSVPENAPLSLSSASSVRQCTTPGCERPAARPIDNPKFCASCFNTSPTSPYSPYG